MLWTICLILGIIIAAGAAFYAAYIARNKRSRIRGLRPIHVLIGGCFLAAVTLQIPVLRYEAEQAGGDVLKGIILSLHSTLQIFTLNSDRNIILESIGLARPRMSAMYSTLLGLLFTVTPLLTFGFLLSFFRNASSRMRYRIHRFADVYVFSCLNEKALCLAEDLRKNHPKAVIAFTGVPAEAGDEPLSAEARALDAICFRENILSIPFYRHSPRAEICFFLTGEDETANAAAALALIGTYRKREHTGLYLFSAGTESEMILSMADPGAMRIRRVNEGRSLVYQMLYDEGYRLFETAGKPGGNGRRRIGAVIVGLDAVGTEMARALTWFGQMDGYEIGIHVFDRDEKAEDRFRAVCPGLADTAHNGALREGGALFDLTIHGGADPETGSFIESVTALKDTTCVLVTLENSAQSIQTAIRLRTAFERAGIHPMILAMTGKTGENRTLTGAATPGGIPYDIVFIDEGRYCCSERGILHSEAEKEALEIHLRWGKERDFWTYEYNYRSSMAAVIHRKAWEKCLAPGKAADAAAERERLSRQEHRRWSAYMLSEGYVYGETRNDLAKTHPDLVDYDGLTRETREKDSRIVDR